MRCATCQQHLYLRSTDQRADLRHWPDSDLPQPLPGWVCNFHPLQARLPAPTHRPGQGSRIDMPATRATRGCSSHGSDTEAAMASSATSSGSTSSRSRPTQSVPMAIRTLQFSTKPGSVTRRTHRTAVTVLTTTEPSPWRSASWAVSRSRRSKLSVRRRQFAESNRVRRRSRGNLSDARICSGAGATVGVPWPPPDPPLPPDDPPIELAGSESPGGSSITASDSMNFSLAGGF